MSTFVVHALIPPLTALAVRYVPARYVWAWVWVSVVPDIDYVGWILFVQSNEVLPNFHRALFHNIWLLLILVALATRSFARYRTHYAGEPGAALRAFAQTRAGAGWILSSYYYFSHMLLDSFQGGIVPLWPLSTYNFFAYFQILVNTQTQEVSPEAEVGVEPDVPMVSPVYEWLNSEQFAITLLIILALGLGAFIGRRAQRIRMVRAVLVQRRGPRGASPGPKTTVSPPRQT